MGREGLPGFYRGFLPNALKNLPNKGRLAPAPFVPNSAGAPFASLMLQVLCCGA